MTDEKRKLQFNSTASKINIPYQTWKNALQGSIYDTAVGINHAPLSGNNNNRNHVASIDNKVGAHFHTHGDEKYEIVSGSGTLYWGKVNAGNSKNLTISEEKPIKVKAGDSFIIPQTYAHQLVNTCKNPLIITFSCPDSHLDDTQDRTCLNDISP